MGARGEAPEVPLPPGALRERVGHTPPGAEGASFYEDLGRHHRRRIDELLLERSPAAAGRMLDFGCGAGRTLSHFLPEAERQEVWGCDIDGRSIRWLRTHLAPPLNVYKCRSSPPLPHPDGYFDTIWALSVFTHIHLDWAEWLLELRRVLADEGRLLLTFQSEGCISLWNTVAGGVPWDPDEVGIATFRIDAPWKRGGPIVFLSEWWIRAHWGRALSVEQLATSGFGPGGQGFAVLRKRPGVFTPEDLKRPEPGEPREAVAAVLEQERLRRDLAALRMSRSRRFRRALTHFSRLRRSPGTR